MSKPLDDAKIEQLLALAEAATPGPWSNALDLVPEGYALTHNGKDSLLALDPDDMAIFDKPRDAAFVAALSPDVVIELLTELRAARVFIRRNREVDERIRELDLESGPRSIR